jgi:D-alanine-D-alanine ligase
MPGREFVLSLWGENGPDNVAIGETRFQNGLRVNSYAAKWEPQSDDFVNSPLTYTPDFEPKLRDEIVAIARGAWKAMGIRGYMRTDIRLDAAGTPRVLDVNPNPELGPGVGICRAAQEAGWTWERFVRQQVEWAAS